MKSYQQFWTEPLFSRFVFISNAAGALKLDMDVRFKVNDLDLTPYLSGPLRHGGGGEEGGAPVFNLYGCVCHFGSGESVTITLLIASVQLVSLMCVNYICSVRWSLHGV